MTGRNRLIAIAIVAAAVIVAVVFVVRRPKAPAGQIDLIDVFPEAEKRASIRSLELTFALEDVTIDGLTKHSIFATPPARLIYTVKVPPHAWLETSFGMRPDSWDKPDSNGSQFRVGVSSAGRYDELLRQYVNPTGRPADRHWQSSKIDLSAYAGQTVKLIFNTDAGPGHDGNTAYDFSVWGAPVIRWQ